MMSAAEQLAWRVPAREGARRTILGRARRSYRDSQDGDRTKAEQMRPRATAKGSRAAAGICRTVARWSARMTSSEGLKRGIGADGRVEGRDSGVEAKGSSGASERAVAGGGSVSRHMSSGKTLQEGQEPVERNRSRHREHKECPKVVNTSAGGTCPAATCIPLRCRSKVVVDMLTRRWGQSKKGHGCASRRGRAGSGVRGDCPAEGVRKAGGTEAGALGGAAKAGRGTTPLPDRIQAGACGAAPQPHIGQPEGRQILDVRPMVRVDVCGQVRMTHGLPRCAGINGAEEGTSEMWAGSRGFRDTGRPMQEAGWIEE
jgi:hypothetical protein